ncbi:histidine kinase [Alcanivorax sp. HI0044]|uniref:sensor histidine kinase n=1 Tax=Alcanivorax sp. HI0044 TaxID=1822234 RepID=UPI0007B90B36|nr:ATP-binding protein [Alcanivorax sp. HI0044]KZY29471.1 histidine kinase [Alcanivorax sp. HI0044]
MLSLKTRIITGLFLVALYGLMAIATALTLPTSDITFQQKAEQLVADIPGTGEILLTAFSNGRSSRPAAPFLLLEEPDVLPHYTELNVFFETHRELSQWLSDGQLMLVDDAGNTYPVQLQQRHLTQLPGLFWLQLVCGLAGMVICILVWVPAKHEVAITSFAVTGLSYVLFSSAAAIYSTRDFFISGTLFAWLSGLNHLGALLFSASLAAFLWNYPRQFPSRWLTTGFYLAFCVAIVIDQTQQVASPVDGFHSWVMAIFLAGLLGSIWQWRQTRQQPGDRSALRWVVISIVAGTAFFAGGMILPAMLQIAQPASQGLLFTTFLLMYLGMALGVVRHRLFALEPWWFSLWSWLLGGLFIMLTDLLLAMMLSLSGPLTLTLSVAFIGWLYFPLRQYLWRRMFLRQRQELDEWLAQALPAMLAQQETQTESGMEQALRAVFQPLSIEALATVNAHISIPDKGQTLIVPAPLEQRTWKLQHAQQGGRIFNRQDIHIAGLVLSLHQLVTQARIAHAKGAKEERLRIRRDMHDDLGAKLLQLLHRSSDTTKPLVREAIHDLRDLLKDMEGESLSLEAAILQWHEETQQRCEDHGAQLVWQARPNATVLGASEFSELTRILREAVTNALKHASTTVLSVTVDSPGSTLTLVVENDGLLAEPPEGTVRGLDIMDGRARKLGGWCQYSKSDDRWQVTLEVPLSSTMA